MIVTFSASRVGVIVHHQADMLEEGAERLVFLHRAGELGEVLEPAGALGRAVGLEHRGVAAIRRASAGPARDGAARRAAPRQRAKSPTRLPSERARLPGQLVAVEDLRRRRCGSGTPCGAGERVDLGDRLVAEPALGGVDDPLEGEVVGGLVR